MSQADRVNQTSPGRDSECGYQRVRCRRGSLNRRNRPGEFWSMLLLLQGAQCVTHFFCNFGTDGTDREDSECPDPAGRCRAGESPWDELCSSGSVCSQSSDEDVKPISHSRVELYPLGGDAREYHPKMCSLLHSGSSAGRGPSGALGGPPYPGIHCR